jgi:retron-type reverse transcriptase
MPAPDVLARALATALLDGDWEHNAMLARLRDTLGTERPWMRRLARATRSRYATAPASALSELARWIHAHESFRDARKDRIPIVHYATPSPEMAESPWRVPALATTRELATWIGFDLDALEVLADRRGISRASTDQRARHYRYAWIPKASGGHRLVEAPKWRLRTVQRRILDGILAPIPPHEAAHGFRQGRSVVTFAQQHVGRAVVLRVDLQVFFASVFAARVVGILRTAGYPEEVSRMLAALCTHRAPADVLAGAPERDPLDLARLRAPHLPQGAPTSGALANLAAYRLDVRVAGLARKIGATYSRYADDLVLSGDRELARAAPTLVARLAAIATEEGFSLNFRKTRVMPQSARQRITGIVVNEKLGAPRAEVERLRAILYNCRRHGPASQNRDGHADFRSHLRGRVAWINSLDPRKGARLQAMFDQLRWE